MSKATYYLLRERVQFDHAVGICQEYVSSSSGFDKREFPLVELAGTGIKLTGFYRRRSFSQPTWVKFINEAFDSGIGDSGGTSDDALMIVEDGNRIWVLSFGALHGISVRLPLERRFGVVAVSNASTPEEVRQIAAHSHGAASMFRLERRGNRGDLSQFLVSRLARRASKIASKVINDVERPVIIEGGLGVYFAAPLTLDDLEAKLARLFGWWNNGQHIHDALRQLDKVRDAEDEGLISARDAELHQLILAGSEQLGVWCDNEQFYLCDPIAVKYPRLLPGLRADASPRRRWIELDLNAIDIEDLVLRYQNIHAADPDGLPEAVVFGTNDQGRQIERPLKHFFTAEIVDGNGEVWVFEEGGWFVVEPRHRDSVRYVVAEECRTSTTILRQWGVDLIDYSEPDGHVDEQAYNRALANANDHLGAVFLDEPDGRLSFHGSTVELGDVFFPQGLLLHVKHETSFGPVSKVCEQAGRAAELIAADPGFRREAEEFLGAKAGGREVSLMNNKRFHWGIGIILKRNRRFPSCLKYRAEECMHDFVYKISASGYQPMITSIKRD